MYFQRVLIPRLCKVCRQSSDLAVHCGLRQEKCLESYNTKTHPPAEGHEISKFMSSRAWAPRQRRALHKICVWGTVQVFIDVMKGLGNALKSRSSRSLANVMNSRPDLHNSFGLISILGGPAISAFTPAIPARNPAIPAFRFLLTDDSEQSLQNS